MNMDRVVYPALSLATALYAAALDSNQRRAPRRARLEPDWTWLEVVVGTSMCLLAAAIRARLPPEGDWHSYEVAVWKAFAWGGTPIIAWQIWRAYEREKQRGDTLQHTIEEWYERKRPPAALAPVRRPGETANSRDG
jgi:hypothetical protein